MNNLAVMLLTAALMVTLMAPVCAQEPALKLPTDGNWLLEFCSVAVNAFVSRPHRPPDSTCSKRDGAPVIFKQCAR